MFAKPFAIGLSLIPAALVHAAGKDVEDLLAHMRGAYAAVRSATFATESHFGRTVYVNTFSYSKPAKIRLAITSVGGSSLKDALVKVTDGNSIALKLPSAVKFSHQKYSLDAYEANLPANLESFCFWDSPRQLSTAKGMNMEHSALKIVNGEAWKGKKWIVLEETATAQRLFCRYFVDPKSYLIWRTVVRQIGAKEDYQDAQITKMDTAAKVPDSIFKVPG